MQRIAYQTIAYQSIAILVTVDDQYYHHHMLTSDNSYTKISLTPCSNF